MQPAKIFLIRLLVLTSVAVAFPCLYAQDLSGLPEAFDAGWKGQKVCEVLYEKGNMRAARCIFPPGIGHEKHFHYPHFGYVLEGGTMRVTDATGAGEDIQLTTGQTWSTDEITVHQGVNIGATTVSVLMVETRPEKPGSE